MSLCHSSHKWLPLQTTLGSEAGHWGHGLGYTVEVNRYMCVCVNMYNVYTVLWGVSELRRVRKAAWRELAFNYFCHKLVEPWV